jgi:hypothetical protein
MKTQVLFLAAILSACGPKTETQPPVEAVAEPLPEAVTLYDRFLEVTNAAESIVGVETMTVRSEMRIPAAGIVGEVVAHWKTTSDSSPSKILVEQNIPGIGSGKVGFDGEIGWSSDNMMGPRLIAGQELDELLWDSQIDSDLKYKDWYTQLETTAKVDFRGSPAWEVKATTKHDRVDTKYFAVESGFLIGSTNEVESPMGPITMETYHSEWAEIEGMWVPKLILIATGAVEMETEITEVLKNPEFEDNYFSPPAEILELWEDHKKQAETPTEEAGAESLNQDSQEPSETDE